MHVTSNDGFQNMFVYQPIFNTSKYKNTSTGNIISWKSNDLYNYRIKQQGFTKHKMLKNYECSLILLL